MGHAALDAAQPADRRPRPRSQARPQADAAHGPAAAAVRPRESNRTSRRLGRAQRDQPPRAQSREPLRPLRAGLRRRQAGRRRDEAGRGARALRHVGALRLPVPVRRQTTRRRATSTTRSSAAPAICTTRALEGTLRIVQSQGALRPGTTRTIKTANHDVRDRRSQLKSKGWHAEDFDRVEFVSDYEVHGLRNHYHNFGLGVPLIAVRKHHEDADPARAVLSAGSVVRRHRVLAAGARRPTRAAGRRRRANVDRPRPIADAATRRSRRDVVHAVLELLRPARQHATSTAAGVDVAAGNRSQHAAGLHPQPAGARREHALDARPAAPREGRAAQRPVHARAVPAGQDSRGDGPRPVVEPRSPGWKCSTTCGATRRSARTTSSGSTCIRRASRSGTAPRRCARTWPHMRAALDPQRRSPALDQMVLVGHSMGGLVSKLQTVDSGNEFWQTLRDKPFAELQADAEMRDDLAETFFFDPNPSIRRVITIGTPHRGSEFSNNFTKWLGRKLIDVPAQDHARPQPARRAQPRLLPAGDAAEHHQQHRLAVAEVADPAGAARGAGGPVGEVPQHRRPGAARRASRTRRRCGCPAKATASCRSPAPGSTASRRRSSCRPTTRRVHRHPQSILEVRRILDEHVAELQASPTAAAWSTPRRSRDGHERRRAAADAGAGGVAAESTDDEVSVGDHTHVTLRSSEGSGLHFTQARFFGRPQNDWRTTHPLGQSP